MVSPALKNVVKTFQGRKGLNRYRRQQCRIFEADFEKYFHRNNLPFVNKQKTNKPLPGDRPRSSSPKNEAPPVT